MHSGIIDTEGINDTGWDLRNDINDIAVTCTVVSMTPL
jgi:hypothetical protein